MNIFTISSAYGHMDDDTESRTLELLVPAGIHVVGHPMTIAGQYFNSTGHFLQEDVTIKYVDINKPAAVKHYDTSVIHSANGQFLDKKFSPPHTGTFLAIAESKSGTLGEIQFEVIDSFDTIAAKIILMIIIAFTILMIVMAFIGDSKITLSIYHVTRFSLITLIVFGVVVFFIFANVELGSNAPVGIVLQHQITEKISTDYKIEPLNLLWMLQFGGNSADGHAAGITIPVYVIIFGVLGGYLRFFYFTSKPWLRNEMMSQLENTELVYMPTRNGNHTTIYLHGKIRIFRLIMFNAYTGIFHSTLSRVLTNRVMSDLSFLIIFPVLSVMMYFVLSQDGLNQADDLVTFAVTSFIAGLFTEDVISRLKKEYTSKEDAPKEDKDDESLDKSSLPDVFKNLVTSDKEFRNFMQDLMNNHDPKKQKTNSTDD